MYSFKNVTTRKHHHCSGCQFIFPPGVVLQKFACLSEGEFFAGYLCKICRDYLSSKDGQWFSENGYMDGEVYHEGWHPDNDNGAFVFEWLANNKPLSVEWRGSWRKPKGQPYEYKTPCNYVTFRQPPDLSRPIHINFLKSQKEAG